MQDHAGLPPDSASVGCREDRCRRPCAGTGMSKRWGCIEGTGSIHPIISVVPIILRDRWHVSAPTEPLMTPASFG